MSRGTWKMSRKQREVIVRVPLSVGTPTRPKIDGTRLTRKDWTRRKQSRKDEDFRWTSCSIVKTRRIRKASAPKAMLELLMTPSQRKQPAWKQDAVTVVNMRCKAISILSTLTFTMTFPDCILTCHIFAISTGLFKMDTWLETSWSITNVE